MTNEHLSHLVKQVQRDGLARRMFLEGYLARLKDDSYDSDFSNVEEFRTHINELFEEHYYKERELGR